MEGSTREISPHSVFEEAKESRRMEDAVLALAVIIEVGIKQVADALNNIAAQTAARNGEGT